VPVSRPASRPLLAPRPPASGGRHTRRPLPGWLAAGSACDAIRTRSPPSFASPPRLSSTARARVSQGCRSPRLCRLVHPTCSFRQPLCLRRLYRGFREQNCQMRRPSPGIRAAHPRHGPRSFHPVCPSRCVGLGEAIVAESRPSAQRVPLLSGMLALDRAPL
jgi:hypothetical protein